jgi:hypothetical protein
MPSFLWYALLPCPYLSNVSFQLSSVQGIALEQMGMGVLARTASESRVKKTSNRHVWCNPSEVKYRVFICFYSTTFIHIIPYVQGCMGRHQIMDQLQLQPMLLVLGCSIHLQAAKGFHLQGVAHQRVVPAIVVPGTESLWPSEKLSRASKPNPRQTTKYTHQPWWMIGYDWMMDEGSSLSLSFSNIIESSAWSPSVFDIRALMGFGPISWLTQPPSSQQSNRSGQT